MKLAAILTAIGAIFGKTWRIIRAVIKLKSLKKEIKEFWNASEKTLKDAKNVKEKLLSYFKEDSDGGKKLTAKEITEATSLITSFFNQLETTYKEGVEAKDEIKKVIDSFKKK